jgi:hypothetical protein
MLEEGQEDRSHVILKQQRFHPFWHTDDRDGKLRRWYAQGVPVRVIAARLGATHNAVVGRAYRLGLHHAGGGAREFSQTAQRDGKGRLVRRWVDNQSS